jgi:uncharacterized protein (TIGR02145 family)
MKYLLLSMFIFFIPLNGLCQRYHQSFGVFLPGDFNKNYIRVTGKIYGLEFKNHYLPGNVGYGGSIQVGFYQNVVNFNISEYAQVLPALNKSQSMRLLLGIGTFQNFGYTRDLSTEISSLVGLIGQIGIQFKPKLLPFLFYGTVDPTYPLTAPGKVNIANFRMGVNYYFGKEDDSQKDPSGDIVSETKVGRKKAEPKEERRTIEEQTESKEVREKEIPWTVEESVVPESSTFTIRDGGTVMDIDGNVYKTMLLGNKRWMAENLKVSRFNNGNLIREVSRDNEWKIAEASSWSIYNNDIAYEKVVGKLYNGHVLLDKREICPSGWHVPSDKEWQDLVNALGGEITAVPKMKSVNGWMGTLKNNNISGLKGLPGGARKEDGLFNGAGKLLVWWTDTSTSEDTKLYCRFISNDKNEILRSSVSLKSGFSIRCKEN